MQKSIKIVYEDVEQNENHEWRTSIKEGLVPFCHQNTEYCVLDSYAANFERFIQDSFECGVIYLSPEMAISVLQIKKYIAYDPQPPKPPQNGAEQPKRKNLRRRSGKKRNTYGSQATNEVKEILPTMEAPTGYDLTADKV